MKMHCKECIVSAPGKAILHGEHAVVHGKVALAVSLNLRTYLRLRPASNGRVSISLPNINTCCNWQLAALKPLLPQSTGVEELDLELLGCLRSFLGLSSDLDTGSQATLAFLYLYLALFTAARDLPSLEVAVWSELPTGAGLGSSAAFSVCLAAALLTASGALPPPDQDPPRWKEEDLQLINRWAFQGERIIHGNPSGVDNAVATWGGILKYQSGKITPLERVPMLRILLTNTKVPRSTKILVAGVKDKINKFPSIMGPVLECVDAISCTCQRTLADMAHHATAEHYRTLEELLDVNQAQLNVLGVGHPALDALCRDTLTHGLHSKLTGAGGGGCGITLLPPGTQGEVVGSVMEALRRRGFDCWETSLGGPGATQHTLASLEPGVLERLGSLDPLETRRS